LSHPSTPTKAYPASRKREAFPIEADGRITVPDAPGLGVSLDQPTVEKYRIG
jgi:L-alanine-DL-glutamate epimerase-like enolase superfamily enzyme